MIYKICPADAWAQAERLGVFAGSPQDKRDGFIHFSTAGQVAGTLAKFYAGADGLILAAVDETGLEDLKYETSRDGAQFPHLYAPLPLARVVWVKPLTRRSDGAFVLPEELGE